MTGVETAEARAALKARDVDVIAASQALTMPNDACFGRARHWYLNAPRVRGSLSALILVNDEGWQVALVVATPELNHHTALRGENEVDHAYMSIRQRDDGIQKLSCQCTLFFGRPMRIRTALCQAKLDEG